MGMIRMNCSRDEMAMINLGIQIAHNGHSRLGNDISDLVTSGEWREIQKRGNQRLLLDAKWGPIKKRRHGHA